MNWIAPLFSGESNYLHALKVLAFALTPMWFGEIFIATPFFSIDKSLPVLCLLYSGYLLYLGLSILMKVSAQMALLYTGMVALALWGASNAPTIAVAIDDFFRQWPVLDQSAKTLIVVLLILSVVGLVLFYERHGKISRKAVLYTGIVAVALWGTSQAPRIAVAIHQLLRQWPLLDGSTKAVIVAVFIVSVVAVTLLYERYRKIARDNSDD